MPSSSGSMLPPDSTATAGRLERGRVVQHRGHGGRAGRLDDHLGPLQQRQQRPRERLLGDGEDVVDVVADRGERDVAGQPDRDAVGHRLHRLELHRGAAGQRAGVRRRALGLHADDPDVGPQRLDRDRDPGEQAAAAGRDEHGLARRAPARGSPGRRCPGRPRCRRGRRGGSAPRRSRPRTPGPRPARPRGSGRGRPRRRRTPRVAFSLGIGAPSGMNTVALMPSSCAASATPCAWLPAEAATTPWARSSSDSREMRT